MGRGFFRTRLLLSLLVVGASLSITNAASEVSEQTPATGNATDQAEQPEDAATVKDKRSWEYNKEMRRMMGASWKKNYGRPVYIGYRLNTLMKNNPKSTPQELSPYLEGDILFKKRPSLSQYGLPWENYRWPNGVVYYKFSGTYNLKQRSAVNQAIKLISAYTCVKFYLRSYQRDYLDITGDDTGCFASVGKQTGRNQINIQPNACDTVGGASHALMHALGFFHEQNRDDRSSYVNINWSNIPRSKWQNFDKHDNTKHFGLPYDFYSVLHYSPNAFALSQWRNSYNVKSKFRIRASQYKGLSWTDIKKINNMYQCNKRDYPN